MNIDKSISDTWWLSSIRSLLHTQSIFSLPLPRRRPHAETPPRCAWGSSNHARHPLNYTWWHRASLKWKRTCSRHLFFDSRRGRAHTRIRRCSLRSPYSLEVIWVEPRRPRRVEWLMDSIGDWVSVIGVCWLTPSLHVWGATECQHAPPPPLPGTGWRTDVMSVCSEQRGVNLIIHIHIFIWVCAQYSEVLLAWV